MKYETAEKLIAMVCTRRPLWDLKDPDYHNRGRRKNLWMEICDELQISFDDAYKRWKSLKDTFLREYKKEINTGRQNKWMHYKSLMFLKNRCQVNNNTVRSSFNGSNASSSTAGGYHLIGGEQLEPNTTTMHIPTEQAIVLEAATGFPNGDNNNGAFQQGVKLSTQSPRPNTTTNNKRVRSKRTREPSDETALPVADSSASADLTSRLISAEHIDYDYYFLISLLPYMKTVRPERKLDVRMKIQRVFSEEQSLQNQNHLHQISQCQSPSSSNVVPQTTLTGIALPGSATVVHHQTHITSSPASSVVHSESQLSNFINSFTADK